MDSTRLYSSKGALPMTIHYFHGWTSMAGGLKPNSFVVGPMAIRP